MKTERFVNKLHIIGIAFFLSFSGCFEDPDLKEVETMKDAKEEEE